MFSTLSIVSNFYIYIYEHILRAFNEDILVFKLKQWYLGFICWFYYNKYAILCLANELFYVQMQWLKVGLANLI